MGGPKFPKVSGYELVAQIGGGGFSTVYRAVHYTDRRVAACKHITLSASTTPSERKSIDKEMKIHAGLKHVHILEFINAVVVEMKHARVYHPGYYLLMELAAGGDLFDKIVPDQGVGEDIAQVFFTQLVSGIHYMHSQGVCHRDLKPENCLLDAAGTLKISDFGLSAVYKLKETGKTRMLSERCGSLPYVAPELNSKEPYQAEPIDVWGIGVILFAMLAGNTPWDEPTMHSPEYCRYVAQKIFDEDPWSRFSEEALSLLCGLLTVDPESRLTLEEAADHPWCQRASQLEAGALADRLTESLRKTGDLEYATPNMGGDDESGANVDEDGDEVMQSAGQMSQFTQTLMLFSQTQSGTRYTPHLTRFYASLGPSLLGPVVLESLQSMGVTCKLPPPISSDDSDDGDARKAVYRIRVGGYDRRKVMFKGWVDIERFSKTGFEGSFCVMSRDVGSPISWRQLWKALILSEAVEPHVWRK